MCPLSWFIELLLMYLVLRAFDAIEEKIWGGGHISS